MHSLSAVADPESCRDALDQYKAAKSELSVQSARTRHAFQATMATMIAQANL
jgi:hypothetical protein